EIRTLSFNSSVPTRLRGPEKFRSPILRSSDVVAADGGAGAVFARDLEVPVDVHASIHGQLVAIHLDRLPLCFDLDLRVVLQSDENALRRLDGDVAAGAIDLDGRFRFAVVLRLGDVALQENRAVGGESQMVQLVVAGAVLE